MGKTDQHLKDLPSMQLKIALSEKRRKQIR